MNVDLNNLPNEVPSTAVKSNLTAKVPSTVVKSNLTAKLMMIQSELKAPKGQYNDFGKYNYRNCEDILNALKPHLMKYKCVVLLTDELAIIGSRFYVRATAQLVDTESNNTISVNAYAREEETKKGMDGSQITGSASSYARKYALNGLFAIDDTKDSDYTNQFGKEPQPPQPQYQAPKQEPPQPKYQAPKQEPPKQEPPQLPIQQVKFAINQVAKKKGVKSSEILSEVQQKVKYQINEAVNLQQAEEVINLLHHM